MNKKTEKKDVLALFEEYNQKVMEIEKELEPQLAPLKAKIKDFDQKIINLKDDLDELERQRKSCRMHITNAEKTFSKDALAYMKEKIRKERTGQKPIVQIDEDETIIELNKKKIEVQQEYKKKIEDYKVKKASIKDIISQLNNEKQPIIDEKKRIEIPLNEAKNLAYKYRKEKEEKEEMDRLYELLSDDSIYQTEELNDYCFDDESDTDSYYEDSSSYSSPFYDPFYSSSSSYEQNKYAEEQAEYLRKQTEYARQQAEEARKQSELAKRQMEELRRQSERAEREARERRLEEAARRRQQEEAARIEQQRIKNEAWQKEHSMRFYHGVIYFYGGRTEKTGSSNNRQLAELFAQQRYKQAMEMATSDYFKPIRYEVVED